VPKQTRDEDFHAALQEVAAQLRELRARAGAPSLRQLSTNIAKDNSLPDAPSVGTLSALFTGKSLTSWQTLETVVRALDGDPEEWFNTWRDLVRLRERQVRLM
jgi:hypothetical protein